MQPVLTATTPVESSVLAALQHELMTRIGSKSYEHWFRGKTHLQVVDDELTVQLTSPFLLTWVQKQFKAELTQAAQAVLGPAARVRCEVALVAPGDRDLSAAPNPLEFSQGSSMLPVGPSMGQAPRTSMISGRTAFAEPQPASGARVSSAGSATMLLENDPTDAARPRPWTEAAPSIVGQPGMASSTSAARVSSGASPRQPAAAPPSTSAPSLFRSASRAAEPAQPRSGRRFADLADFVPGPCNELALTAARGICHSPGREFGHLFLYGGVGLGKTHLLEGMYRQLRRGHPSLQVVFLSSEAFANYFTQALRDHTLPSFRHRFRTVDVLLIDDVDFFEGKRVIQEEFLHTLKQLESHGRQVAATADRHPRLLSKMTNELRTRLLSGMVCRLEAPDAETRATFVTRRAERLEAEFTPEALAYVAERFTSNVREIEGALNCLANYHRTMGKRIGVTTARQVLADLERDCVKIVRMADIERVVCALFGIDPTELRSAKRSRSLSQPRMLAMFLARKHTRCAYSEIGQHFGGRNHSTVISAERKVQSCVDTGETVQVASHSWRFAEVLDMLEQQLLAG